MLKKIGVIVGIVLLAILFLYAAPPTRALIQENVIDRLGPPVAGGFEAAGLAITNSWVWQGYSHFIAMGLGAGITGFIAYLYVSGYAKVERHFVKRSVERTTGGGGTRPPLAEVKATTPSIAATRPEPEVAIAQPEPKEEAKAS